MMYSNADIRAAMQRGDLVIRPFNEANLGINSYDVTLGEHFFDVRWEDHEPHFYGFKIKPNNTFHMVRGRTVLAHTVEYVGTSPDIVALMHNRSSKRRVGQRSCDCAGFGDGGFSSYWVAELSLSAPGVANLTVGTRFAQLSFDQLVTPPEGRYTGQYDPQDLDAEWPLLMIPKEYRHPWLIHWIEYEDYLAEILAF
jgi:dCTP deaminase